MRESAVTTSVPPNDWLYYRIHVDAADAGDRLLKQVVRPVLRELTAELPTSAGPRWFFLRFSDVTGLHVRLRLNAERQALQQAQRALDTALAAAGAQKSPICESFGKYLYAPEIWKFGDGYGMRLAEELFQASSEMVLEFFSDQPSISRVDYGTAHLLQMVAGLPERQRASFLHQYAWYWSGGPTRRPGHPAPGGPRRPDRSDDEVAQLLSQARRALDAPVAGAALRRYRARFWDAMHGSERNLIPRSDYFLLFHHIHLTNNRIGVFPAVESAIARMLWLAMRNGMMTNFMPVA